MLQRILICFLVVLALASCGGHGGTSSGPSLHYVTDWSQAGVSGPDGQSQRIRLLRADDTDAVTPVVVPRGPSTKSAKISGIAAGNFRLRVELWSQAGAHGAINGVFEEFLTITSSTSVATAVGTTTDHISVGPSNATIVTPSSARFIASPLDHAGRGVFLTANPFTWSVSGPATVSNDGIVIPSGAGSGTVIATLNALSGNATYSSSTSTPTSSKWTVLVFMNAANNLDIFALANLDQIERVADNPDVRFVVQWKESELVGNATFDSTKRYLMQGNQTSGVQSPMLEDLGSGVDMGDKQTLRDFIAWGQANFPATRYCVVVWDHGNGWKAQPNVLFQPRGVSYDDSTGHHIDTVDLPYALGGVPLDIVAWDSSLMQMLEVAYQIRSVAAYVVGSEESPPGAGYPYDVVFKPMHDNPDDTTRNITKGFVDGMVNDPNYVGQKITESSIDTSQLPALATALDGLAQELIANSGSFAQAVIDARNTAQAYLPLPGRVYRDLFDICTKLEAGAGVPQSTITACQNVQAAVTNVLAWEGHSAQSANSHGISIDFSSSTAFQSGSTEYNGLDLSNDTHWNEWLAMAP